MYVRVCHELTLADVAEEETETFAGVKTSQEKHFNCEFAV